MASSYHATPDVIAYKEAGQLVQLGYDTWTPRPHFMVLQCEAKQDASTLELQATYETIGHFLHENPQFDKETILSFHRGQWYQQYTNKWHAHLCVPKQPYLQQAVVRIEKVPRNKQWKGARTVEEGINAWHTRKIQEYVSYQSSCVQKGTSERSSVETIPLSTFNYNPKEFELVWTYPAPRIGVIARSPAAITLASLYTFITNFHSNADKELGQREKSFSNFGCHLCLYVRGQSGTNVTCRPGQIFREDGGLSENSDIIGYIQMDECQYVQWLPRHIKQIWLEIFSQAEHFVRT